MPDDTRKTHGDFAAGERTEPPGPERDFAEGEEHRPPGGPERDFAEGEEHRPPGAAPERDFAEGQEEEREDDPED